MIVFSLPSGGMFILPEREHDGFPVSVPTVSWLPALSELLLAWPCQWSPQQPAPDEGALILGKVAKPPSLMFSHRVLPFPKQSQRPISLRECGKIFLPHIRLFSQILTFPVLSMQPRRDFMGFYSFREIKLYWLNLLHCRLLPKLHHYVDCHFFFMPECMKHKTLSVIWKKQSMTSQKPGGWMFCMFCSSTSVTNWCKLWTSMKHICDI